MKKLIITLLAITAGSVHAADFTGLQAFKAADIAAAAESYNATVPAQAPAETGAETLSRLGAAVTDMQVKYRAAGLAEQPAIAAGLTVLLREYGDCQARLLRGETVCLSGDRAKKSSIGARELEEIPTSLYINGAYGAVKTDLVLDIRPGSSPRKPAAAEVTVSGHGVNGEKPQMAVVSLKVYEMGTGRLAAAFDNPRPETNLASWEKRFQVFRFEIPRENLDPAARYTFVAALSVNGSPAWDVRSEFESVYIRK